MKFEYTEINQTLSDIKALIAEGCMLLCKDIEIAFMLQVDLKVYRHTITSYNKVDKIYTSVEQLSSIADSYKDYKFNVMDFYKRSFIKLFQLNINYKVASNVLAEPCDKPDDNLILMFNKSPVQAFFVKTSDGALLKIFPVADVAGQGVIYTIGYIMVVGKKIWQDYDFIPFMSMPLAVYRNGADFRFDLLAGKPKEVINNFFTGAYSYITLFKLFTHKPEILINHSQDIEIDNNTKQSKYTNKNRHKKRNTVQIVKRIDLDKAIVARKGVAKGKHIIECPAWGVAGHSRTYKKTGNTIWIEPYIKGKDRDKVDQYEAKNYKSKKG